MSSRRVGDHRGRSGADITRRNVLAAAGLLGGGLLAGCPGGAGEQTALELREPSPPEMGLATVESGLRDDQVALVREAAPDGTATAHGYDPFRREDYVRVEGTYYRVRTEKGGLERVAKPVLVVSRTGETADAVPLEEYGGHVVELVAPLTGGNDTRTRVLHPDTDGFEALHPEPPDEYVRWENSTYRLAVEERRVEQQVRRVRVDAVAETPAEFEAHLRTAVVETVIEPVELSDRGREILRRAIDGEYEEEAPYSGPFESVLETVRGGGAIERGEWGGVFLVVYDDVLYRAEIRTMSWG